MGKNTGMMPNKSGSRQITETVAKEGSPEGGGKTGRPDAHGGQLPASSVMHDGKIPSGMNRSKMSARGESTVDKTSIEARQDRGEPAELRMAGKKESSVGTNEY